jgi:DNA-directed RNA polymerase subunit RPC12/RpoP
MRHLLTFEGMTGCSIGIEYKSCRDCNSSYEVYKPKSINCKYCGSKDLQDITEDEYYDGLSDRLDPNEFVDVIKKRKRMREASIDSTINIDDYSN